MRIVEALRRNKYFTLKNCEKGQKLEGINKPLFKSERKNRSRKWFKARKLK